MSRLSALQSNLSACLAELDKINDILNNLIPPAEKAYSDFCSEFSATRANINAFEESASLKINRPLAAGCSGKRIDAIMNKVSSIGSGNEFLSQISKLESDVEHTYSDLQHAKFDLQNKANEIQNQVRSLRQEISEEEERLAKEAAARAKKNQTTGDMQKYTQ